MLPLFALLAPAFAGAEDNVMVNQYGEVLHWGVDVIDFVVDPQNKDGLEEDGAVDAADDAAQAWNDIETVAIEFNLTGRKNGFQGGYDQENGVYFVDEWTSSPDLLALTTAWSNEEGEILDFDLAVNTDDHDWALDGAVGKADLQNTLAHEFGHALGADHIEHDESATMFSSSTPGEVLKRDLADADVAVAEWLYPDLPEGSELDARPLGACNAAPVGLGWAAAPAILLAFLRRQVSR